MLYDQLVTSLLTIIDDCGYWLTTIDILTSGWLVSYSCMHACVYLVFDDWLIVYFSLFREYSIKLFNLNKIIIKYIINDEYQSINQSIVNE